MSTDTHTPGPWAIEEVGAGELFIVRKAADGSWALQICELDYTDDCNGNARLIAAAPDLLEACKEVANFPEVWMNDPDGRIARETWHDVLIGVRTAIAKATGPPEQKPQLDT